MSWSPLVHVCTNAAVTGRMALGLAEAKTNQASKVIGKGHHFKENQNNKTGGPLKVLHFCQKCCERGILQKQCNPYELY